MSTLTYHQLAALCELAAPVEAKPAAPEPERRPETPNCISCASTVERPRIACAVVPCPRREEIARNREIARRSCREACAREATIETRALFGAHRPRPAQLPPPLNYQERRPPSWTP